MKAPNPIDFGIRGMAAALNMTEDEFCTAYRNGEVERPERVFSKEPRWSVLTLGKEINKRMPPAPGLENLVLAMEALLRAERAEGYHNGG